MNKFIVFILLFFTHFSYSQQLVKLCENDSLKSFTYTTSSGVLGNYFWSIDGSDVTNNGPNLQQEWTPQDLGQHQITVFFQDELGCPSQIENLSISIELCKNTTIFAPNCFTPNGDKSNNIWFVKGENYTDGFLSIVNRWGEIIFETNNFDNGWDGTYNNLDCPDGVYFYILNWKDSDGFSHKQTGHINLLR